MSPELQQVLQSAIALPAGDQVELIEALVAGLDVTDPQPLDEACVAEIQRRSAEYDAGKVSSIPWPNVRDRGCTGNGLNA